MLLCSTEPHFFLCVFTFLSIKLFLVEDGHLRPSVHQSRRHFREEGWTPVWAFIYYRGKSFPLEDRGQTLSSEYTEHVRRAGGGLQVKLCPSASRLRGFSTRQSSRLPQQKGAGKPLPCWGCGWRSCAGRVGAGGVPAPAD